jgi:hypothetical protein
MALAVASTELEMVQDARQYLLANGGTTAELEINQRLIDKYSKEGPSRIAGGGFPMQRTGGPKKARQPDMAKPGQISYATDLLRRLWGHDRAVCAELTELLPTRTRQGISRQIDNLISILASIPRPLNPELRVHLQDLWTRKMGKVDGSRNPAMDEAFAARLATMTYDEGRKLAARLQEMADGPAPATPASATGVGAPELVDGMYEDPDGTIWKVQVAHHGSGQLYAKQLTKLEIPKIVRGKEVGYGFVYVPGAIKRMRPEWKMTRERAAEWGKLYGHCVRCGAILTDETSQDRGLGPVCWGKM